MKLETPEMIKLFEKEGNARKQLKRLCTLQLQIQLLSWEDLLPQLSAMWDFTPIDLVFLTKWT